MKAFRAANLVAASILFSSIFAVAGTADPGTIDGTGRDVQTGNVLPGANVQIKGTTLGASTDLDGQF